MQITDKMVLVKACGSEGRSEMFDITEYERIVREYRVPLFKYCYYRLRGNLELTEETVDDILYVLYRKWDRIDTDSNVRAWLYRVADREIKSHLKKYEQYYKNIESLDEAADDGRTESLGYYDEYFADHTPEEEYILSVRQRLPDGDREIFTLRFMEKRTIEDISCFTGIPYSTLRLRINKLERLIRIEIKNIFDK